MKITLTPIMPKMNRFNAARYKAEIEKAQAEVKAGILADYQAVTSTWQHKVKFNATRKGDTYYFSTKDPIFGYVELGTKAHVIRPRGPWKLRFFRTRFRPKTKPGVIPSGAGRQANRDLTFAKEVHHPGNKPRKFGKMIKDKWLKIFHERVQMAIRIAAKG